MDRINKDMISKLCKDMKMLGQLKVPCCAFIICETEEGYNRACKYNDFVEMYEF